MSKSEPELVGEVYAVISIIAVSLLVLALIGQVIAGVIIMAFS